MNREELAFANQQLAGMLNCGIPLEGGLRQLCENMRRGALRKELEALEADLSRGVPLRKAIEPRGLPELYKQMLIIGAESNNLPGTLNLLADYYNHTHALTLRLKGLMVYPAIIFVCSLVLSFALAMLFRPLLQDVFLNMFDPEDVPPMGTLWVLPVALLMAMSILATMILLPTVRRWLFWRLPGFRDIGLARVGASMHLLLRGGVPLPQALGLVSGMESRGPAAADLQAWQAQISAGHGRLDQVAGMLKALSPFFLWLVASSGEDLAKGFLRASEIYARRARHQSEMILFAAVPVSVLFLAVFLVSQLGPVFRALVVLMDKVGLP